LSTSGVLMSRNTGAKVGQANKLGAADGELPLIFALSLKYRDTK